MSAVVEYLSNKASAEEIATTCDEEAASVRQEQAGKTNSVPTAFEMADEFEIGRAHV